MFTQQQHKMEATAVCTNLFMNVLLLLAVSQCYNTQPDAAFPRIDPSRLQFFEYDSIFISCDELEVSSEWRVMKKLKEDPANTTQWETSTGSIAIKLAFTSDSGEYWCEDEDGGRSNSINITVTAGDVILVSPPLPVTEGDSVSLHCRDKMADSNLPADFYKDGLLSGTGYEGHLVISGVSKSHQGLYKCSISGAEESAESWLAVRAHMNLSPEESPESPSTDSSPHLFIFLSVVFTVCGVAVLPLLMGLLYYQKHEVSERGASDAVTSVVTYAVTKPVEEVAESSCFTCEREEEQL